MKFKKTIATILAMSTMLSVGGVIASADKLVEGTQKTYYYQYDNGTYAKNKTVKSGSSYYYFDSDGKMTTGWLVLKSGIYHFGADGKMSLGLTQVGDSYYYFDKKTGRMVQKNWVKSGDYVYYCDTYGAITKKLTYEDYQKKQSGLTASKDTANTSQSKLKESNKYYDIELKSSKIKQDADNRDWLVLEYTFTLKDAGAEVSTHPFDNNLSMLDSYGDIRVQTFADGECIDAESNTYVYTKNVPGDIRGNAIVVNEECTLRVGYRLPSEYKSLEFRVIDTGYLKTDDPIIHGAVANK